MGAIDGWGAKPKRDAKRYENKFVVASLGTFRLPEGTPNSLQTIKDFYNDPLASLHKRAAAELAAAAEKHLEDLNKWIISCASSGVSGKPIPTMPNPTTAVAPRPTGAPTLAHMVRVPSPTQTSLSVLLKGVSGSGKTRTALSFPEPILVLYADVNRETVRTVAKSGTNLKTIPIESWTQYENQIIPCIAERKLGIVNEDGTQWEPRTIVLDTFDFLSDLLWREIQGNRDQLQIPDYGKGLRRMANTTRELIYSTTPRAGHPGYHVVVCSHVKDITDDGGNLVKVSPAVMGQFKDQIEDYFDYVLLCESEVASKVEGAKVTKARRFKIHAAPPNRYHTCKGGALPTELDVPEGDSAFTILNKHLEIETTKED